MNENGDLATAEPGRLRSGASSLSERVQSLRLPDRASGSSRGSWLPWLLSLFLLGTTIFFGIEALSPIDPDLLAKATDGQAPSAAKALAKVAKSGGKSTTIASDSATEATNGIMLESKGYVVPSHLVQVSPKVGGMVVSLRIEENQWVDKDAILAEIENTEFLAEYNRVLSQYNGADARWQELWVYRDDEIRQAKAELDDAIAQREQYFAEYKRSSALKGTQGVVSQKDWEQAEAAYRSQDFRVQRSQLTYELLKKGPRDKRIAAAKAEMEQFKAELTKAKWKLDSCQVRAPISGHIISKKAEMGNMVNPSAFSNGLSASLCEMANLAELEVDLSIAERDIRKVSVGQICKVRPEGFPDRIYDGKVDRIMPLADRAKSAVPVRVRIEIPRGEEGKYLRPDMGAVVTFYSAKVSAKE